MAGLLVPLCLGVMGELLQRKVLARRFQWSDALWRALTAVPVMAGPIYALGWVLMLRPDSRPRHWIEMLILLCGLSCSFAYRALRIKTQLKRS